MRLAEHAERGAIRAPQFEKLTALLAKALATNTFYRDHRAGVDLARITSLEAFAGEVPVIRKRDLIADQDAAPPFGRRMAYARAQGGPLMVSTTSGTNHRQSVEVHAQTMAECARTRPRCPTIRCAGAGSIRATTSYLAHLAAVSDAMPPSAGLKAPFGGGEGGAISRIDDMKTIKGVNVRPQAVDDALFAHPEVDEYEIWLTDDAGGADVATELGGAGRVMPKAEIPAGRQAAFVERIADGLRARIGIRFAVEIVPPGTLSHSEYKVRRWHDQRERVR